jgi:truncated hemoglobin YjbI
MPHPLIARAASNNQEPPAGLNEEMMERLVREFYGIARQDPVLGPIFAERLDGHWEEHIARLTDFWSQIGLRTGRYAGRRRQHHCAGRQNSRRKADRGCRNSVATRQPEVFATMA